MSDAEPDFYNATCAGCGLSLTRPYDAIWKSTRRRVAFLEGREDSYIAHTVGQGHESTLDNELVKPARGPAEPYVTEQAA